MLRRRVLFSSLSVLTGSGTIAVLAPFSSKTTRRQYKWQVKQRNMSLARGGQYPWDWVWKENPGHTGKQESSPGDQSVFIYSIYSQWQQQGCVLMCYEPRYRTFVTNALTAAVSSASVKHKQNWKIREQGSEMQGMQVNNFLRSLV